VVACPRVANDGTDLQKVGFVFLGEVMPVEWRKIVELTPFCKKNIDNFFNLNGNLIII